VVHLDELDQKRAEALAKDPDALADASESTADDLRRGVTRLVWRVAAVSLLGAMALAAVVYRSMRRVALCGGLSLLILGGTVAVAVATFRPAAIEEPRYDGLLSNAPAILGDARRIAGRYEQYREELQRMVQNVGRLYGSVSALPGGEADPYTTRVLHISDMHLNPTAWSVVQTVVEQFHIDLVVDTGDLTDWGTPMEANYVAAIGQLTVPYVFVRGNHDSAATAAQVARQPNALVLDNSAVSVDGLLIAGIADPRFTPDKSAPGNDPGLGARNDSIEAAAGQALGDGFASFGRTPDLVLLHEPPAAGPLAGRCPLILAGHTHQRAVRWLDTPAGAPLAAPHTLLMVQGSTGGAGLRGLETKQILPLAVSVLYFDFTRTLQAYDDIAVGGTGQTDVTLQRHLVVDPDKPQPTSSLTPGFPPSAGPSGSLSGSPSVSPS
jgi:predicted MPP superfamily phosphohydrolase